MLGKIWFWIEEWGPLTGFLVFMGIVVIFPLYKITTFGDPNIENLGQVTYVELVDNTPVVHTDKEFIIELQNREDISFIYYDIGKNVYLKYSKYSSDDRYHSSSSSICFGKKNNCFEMKKVYTTVMRNYDNKVY